MCREGENPGNKASNNITRWDIECVWFMMAIELQYCVTIILCWSQADVRAGYILLRCVGVGWIPQESARLLCDYC